jgi:transcriptional regulator with XRE-family HTH domain
MSKILSSLPKYRLGQLIRKYRLQKKMTQLMLARSLGIQRSHLSGIELGNYEIGITKAVFIAQILGINSDDISGLFGV